MLEANKIASKALKRYWSKDDASKINADWLPKVRRILFALDAATDPAELDLPGYHWHELKGDRKGTYSVRITANWRITFQWADRGPFNVDMEDYHG